MAINPQLAQAILGLQAPDLVGSFQQGQQIAKERQEEERQAQIRELKGQILAGGEGMGRLTGLAPEVAFELKKQLGVQDAAEMAAFVESAEVAQSMMERGDWQGAKDFANQRSALLRQQGRDSRQTDVVADLLNSNQNERALSSVKAFTSGLREASLTPREQEFKRFQQMPEGPEKDQFGRLIGAISKRDTIDEDAERTRKREEAKLSAQKKLKPVVAAAVFDALEVVKTDAKRAEAERSDAQAFDVYERAIDGLTSALGGTETGVVVGLGPAMSENARIAEGALAAMAPVLKQLFVRAGEGTFTDNDQKVLMAMLPDRQDSPKARAAKLENIDIIVRAKLGRKQREATQPPPPPPPQAQAAPQRNIEVDF